MTEHELSELDDYCRWRHEVEPEIPLHLITEVRRSAMPGSMGNTGCSRSRATARSGGAR